MQLEAHIPTCGSNTALPDDVGNKPTNRQESYKIDYINDLSEKFG